MKYIAREIEIGMFVPVRQLEDLVW